MDEFKLAVGPQTSPLLLCNPHSPLGHVFGISELEAIAEICLLNRVHIITDEIHCDLIYQGHRHVPLASLSPEIDHQTITVMSPSKTFHLAGLEIAIAIIPDVELRRGFEASRQGSVPTPNVLANVAAVAAYRDGQEWLLTLLAYLESNRDF